MLIYLGLIYCPLVMLRGKKKGGEKVGIVFSGDILVVAFEQYGIS